MTFHRMFNQHPDSKGAKDREYLTINNDMITIARKQMMEFLENIETAHPIDIDFFKKQFDKKFHADKIAELEREILRLDKKGGCCCGSC
jgi:hypothetical protein